MKIYHKSSGPLTVGWMGSPTSSYALPQLLGVLEKYTRAGKIRVIFVGSGPIENKIPGLELREWSLDRQQTDLLEFDIGIMPLEDNPWNQGKCGFKLLQYMGLGIPVIASDVSANKNIVTQGVDGFLVRNEREWDAAIQKFLNNRELLKQMGKAARQKVETQFCLEIYGDRYCQLLRSATMRVSVK